MNLSSNTLRFLCHPESGFQPVRDPVDLPGDPARWAGRLHEIRRPEDGDSG